MASFLATIVRFPLSSLSVNCNINQGVGISPSRARLGWAESRFQPLRNTRLSITCAAKAETIEKVCDVVKKQLALSADTEVTADTTFAKLGADSLDTVEIVMALEEEFDISVEEENAQSITNIQEAAEVIDKLVEKKAA